MHFSEQWLRTWVNPSMTTEQLSDTLTMGGLEVEELTPAAPAFTGVVVGQILSIEKHPDADKLNVCKVDVGTGELLQIVCGAPNAAVGIKIPAALIGAELPNDFKIKAAKLRGVASSGMLCSARELGINDEASGLMELPSDAPVGMNIRDYLNLDDHVFTIKLTPNRADCLSIRGVARDVAAITGAPLKSFTAEAVATTITDELPIRVDEPVACGRFTGRVMKNVNAAAPTPLWIVQRLERAGVRSISALVDITAYVMLELGQPMHVYDLSKIQGTLHARMAKNGESIKLLNEQTHTLQDDVLVIADDSGAIGIAGIMGGDSTKAELHSTDIFLEAAFFSPDAIAGKARRLKFSTDASHRYERGVDFMNQREAIEYATRLVLDICGGEVGPVSEVISTLPTRGELTMRVSRAQKVIGVAIPADDMAKHLSQLQLAVTRGNDDKHGETLTVTAPSYRFDMAIEEDLIEEVARLFGYDNIPVRDPVATMTMLKVPESERVLDAVRDALVTMDYQEVINFSFIDDALESDFAGKDSDPIKLQNPIASSLSVMRTQLIASLVMNLKTNLARSQSRVRVFEIAKVFHRDTKVTASDSTVPNIAQPLKLAGLAYGSNAPEQWASVTTDIDFYDVKGDIERLFAPSKLTFEPHSHVAAHPGRCAKIVLNGQTIGWLGQMHPRLQQAHDLPKAPMLFELDATAVIARTVPIASDVSKQQMVTRDLALIVPRDVSAQAIENAFAALRQKDASAAIIRDVQLFDLYQGEHMAANEKSMAYRFHLQDMNATLTDAQIDDLMQKVLATVIEQTGARLR
ncbi:phenylalanine--tRNA ligase beta subunit [Formosimonas limnophila]|uniref:Phenylalanine--tRNA ligase beta subunit n=1 Tax=Formosimonas limnophila TaxID=1384487 RepID=A0A8J3CGQ0_9BURK|nr:phenylalanine--tRNA ligase subunit beta [Formosimonas limnophila]GHA70897.1 phenylalanine--tRNA ligase beta subunit [Formosimonas limnophila]